MILSDNSFKVFRFENNKQLVDSQNLKIEKKSQLKQFALNSSGRQSMVVTKGSLLQFKQILDQEGPVVQSELDTNPRNFVGSSDYGENPEVSVKSLDFSSNGKSLVTFETLEDTRFDNKKIIVEHLKIWEKQTADSEFELK